METLIHRKHRITLTAVEIINELGIQGLSTREIAKRQGISEGTLFKHYKNKNEILLSVLDLYAKYDIDIIQSIKLKELPYLEAVEHFIRAYVEYYENYPEITAISQAYDVLACDSNLAEKIINIYSIRYLFILQAIDGAKEHGELSVEINSQHLADIIVGLFSSICLRWRFAKYSFSLKEQTMETLTSTLNAFKKI